MVSKKIRNFGKLEVICGSMFSGKTTELIKKLSILQEQGEEVGLFKPLLDTRNPSNFIYSHKGEKMPCIEINSSADILEKSYPFTIIGIDEVQFLSQEIVEICLKLLAQNKKVIVAGLDMDYKGKPFGPIPHLLAICDDFCKLHSLCSVCGDKANISYRTTAKFSKNYNEQVVIGGSENYEPRCRKCCVYEQ